MPMPPSAGCSAHPTVTGDGTSRIGVFETDIEENEVEWDERLLSIYGMENTPRIKADDYWERALHPQDRARVLENIRSHIDDEDGLLHEFRIIRPDGTERVIRARAASFTDSHGHKKMIGADWDVTEEVSLRLELERAKTLAEARNVELETAKEQIEHIALHDHLTGLPNRRYLDQVLHERAAECRADGSLLIVFHIDLDRFKQINDTLGHRAGDMMLKHTGDVLKASVGAGDFVARIGRDEFIVVGRCREFSKRSPVSPPTSSANCARTSHGGRRHTRLHSQRKLARERLRRKSHAAKAARNDKIGSAGSYILPVSDAAQAISARLFREVTEAFIPSSRKSL